MSYTIVKRTVSLGSSVFVIDIDVENRQDDALTLAMLYAEEHCKRCWSGECVLHIGAMQNSDGIYGYRFLTPNGSVVEYYLERVTSGR